MLSRRLGLVGLVSLLALSPAWSQELPPVRVRGTIERVDGPVYLVKASNGTEVKVVMADKPQIAGVVRASLSDIKPGS